MSSMLKKKGGGLAFKPKIPSARSRPANVPSAPAPKSVESQPLVDSTRREATCTGARADSVIDGHATSSIRTIESQTEQSSPKCPEPSQRIAEREPYGESSPPASFFAQNVSDPSTSLVPEVVANINNDSSVAQADTSTQSTTGNEAATVPTLEPTANSSFVSPPEPLSVSPSENHVMQEACPAAPSQTTPDEAIPCAAPDQSAAIEQANTSATAGDSSISKEKKTRKRRQEAKKGGQSKDPPQKRQRKKTTKESEEAAPGPRKRKRKTGEDAKESSEVKKKKEKKKRGRARSLTPEDAESQMVDLQQLRMADLTKDLRIGKKFSRHDELRERERKSRSRVKASQPQEDEEPSTTGEAPPAPPTPTTQAEGPQDSSSKSNDKANNSSLSAPATEGATTSGPQFRIVDGQIVVDQNSLVMDRHARSALAQARGDMETIEENDFTRHITSSSFMTSSKLKGPNIWTVDETELFYRGLRMFGTEFEMISKMFPGKQRRHVKLKFNREERHNPKRIDAALIGEKTTKLDIDEYRAFTGTEFESVETIEAEQRKIGERYELERKRIADEQAESMRKKREALFADDDDDDDDDDDNNDHVANARRKRSGRTRRKGRETVAYGLNGEPINRAD